MKHLALQANWIHPSSVERWLSSMVIGRTLNVCCGKSRVGEVRVDISPDTSRTEEGDLFNLRFAARSFATVICDPPYSYYNKMAWLRKLSTIADKRLIVSSDRVDLRRVFWEDANWGIRLFAAGNGNVGQGFFLRLYWVFDRLDGQLSE